MPTLTRTYRWERFEPHLGDNLELPPAQRFYLEVASGLTRAQLEDVKRAHQAAIDVSAEAPDFSASVQPMAEALKDVVRLGREPLTVDGMPIDTLEKYVALVMGPQCLFNVVELTNAVREFNTLGGTFAHFSEWRSGGSSGTRAPSAGATTAGQ